MDGWDDDPLGSSLEDMVQAGGISDGQLEDLYSQMDEKYPGFVTNGIEMTAKSEKPLVRHAHPLRSHPVNGTGWVYSKRVAPKTFPGVNFMPVI